MRDSYLLLSNLAAERFNRLADALRRDDRGVTAVEYGIMVALIAVVIIVAVSFLGTNLSSLFSNVGSTIGSKV